MRHIIPSSSSQLILCVTQNYKKNEWLLSMSGKLLVENYLANGTINVFNMKLSKKDFT